MKKRLLQIKKQFNLPEKEEFTAAPSGTHYKVFISNNYVIRFRDENPDLLLREANFLKKLNHPLIPRVLEVGKINSSFFMIENRIPGKTIDLVWKNLSINNKNNIIKQIIDFLQYERTIIKNNIYSVKTGKSYKSFSDYLLEDANKKIACIKKNEKTKKTLIKLLSIIIETKNLLANKERITLVHGDLIIHNLLTDNKNLTGVLDWELALFGNPDYDLFRLFYYQECAKAYQEQDIDETFEADYMDKLNQAILQSNLIEDKESFWKKYQFVRAVFYLNSLYWAVNSANPEKNTNELIFQWNKKKD